MGDNMEIYMFQRVELRLDGQVYDLSQYLPKTILSLFMILVLHNQTFVSNQTLISILWEESENPSSALKFAIYRLRQILKKIPELADLTLIHTKKSGYMFLAPSEVYIDCLDMIACSKLLESQTKLDKKTAEAANHICDIYNDSLYLPCSHIWFIQETEYFRQLYIQSVKKLWNYYDTLQDYTAMRYVSIKAARLEPSIEQLHRMYLQSLLYAKEFHTAYHYYQNCTSMLVKEYAILISDDMKLLYEKIIKHNHHKVTLSMIMDYYQQKTYQEHGAFYCDNTTFDYIYDLRLRSAKRENTNYYLVIFEIQNSDSRLDLQMERLHHAIMQSIRTNDVFTRLNKYQFLTLMPCPNEEQVNIISARVSARYYNKSRGNQIRLNYYIGKP